MVRFLKEVEMVCARSAAPFPIMLLRNVPADPLSVYTTTTTSNILQAVLVEYEVYKQRQVTLNNTANRWWKEETNVKKKSMHLE